MIQGYSFELITGPMSCGKTEELLRRIRRCIIAKKKVKVISPDVDTRTKVIILNQETDYGLMQLRLNIQYKF